MQKQFIFHTTNTITTLGYSKLSSMGVKNQIKNLCQSRIVVCNILKACLQ